MAHYDTSYPEYHEFCVTVLYFYLQRKIHPSSLEYCLPNEIRRWSHNFQEGIEKIPKQYREEFWRNVRDFANEYEPFTRFNVDPNYIKSLEQKCLKIYNS